MPLYGLRALKLAFVFSVVVSGVQILLYRTIVLNAKHTHVSRYPWKPGILEAKRDKPAKESARNVYTYKQPSTVKMLETTEKKMPATTEKVEEVVGVKPKTCTLHTQVPESYQLAKAHSDMSDWRFNNRAPCTNLDFNEKRTPRWKFILSCNKIEAFMGFVKSNSTNDIQRFYPEDKCLNLFINQCCADEFPVPNVVHYIWYGKQEMQFFEFASFMSAIRFVRPCAILVHGDTIPGGKYWDLIVTLFPKIIHVFRRVPKVLFGKDVQYKEHVGDAWKIKSLLKFGGIYMDTDMLLVKSVGPLRHHPFTMSRQTANKTVSSAFIMAEKNATFLQGWLQWYQIYYVNDSYSYNAMMYPPFLAGRKPSSVHIEYGTASRPIGQVGDKIFRTNTNWSDIYGMHLFLKLYRERAAVIDENNVKNSNTTVGAISRHILFGNKELCW